MVSVVSLPIPKRLKSPSGENGSILFIQHQHSFSCPLCARHCSSTRRTEEDKNRRGFCSQGAYIFAGRVMKSQRVNQYTPKISSKSLKSYTHTKKKKMKNGGIGTRPPSPRDKSCDHCYWSFFNLTQTRWGSWSQESSEFPREESLQNIHWLYLRIPSATVTKEQTFKLLTTPTGF